MAAEEPLFPPLKWSQSEMRDVNRFLHAKETKFRDEIVSIYNEDVMNKR